MSLGMNKQVLKTKAVLYYSFILFRYLPISISIAGRAGHRAHEPHPGLPTSRSSPFHLLLLPPFLSPKSLRVRALLLLPSSCSNLVTRLTTSSERQGEAEGANLPDDERVGLKAREKRVKKPNPQFPTSLAQSGFSWACQSPCNLLLREA